MDPPPPRFDSPLRAVSATTKQLQHTKHLQRPAQQRQQRQQHQQQQQTTQRRQQQRQPNAAAAAAAADHPAPAAAAAAAAADDPAPAEQQQHQQQQHQQQTTGSPASFRSPPLASSLEEAFDLHFCRSQKLRQAQGQLWGFWWFRVVSMFGARTSIRILYSDTPVGDPK